MRYCARATDSQLPLIVIVRSRLAGASRSSQFEIRIMAPLICLKTQGVDHLFYKLLQFFFVFLANKFTHIFWCPIQSFSANFLGQGFFSFFVVLVIGLDTVLPNNTNVPSVFSNTWWCIVPCLKSQRNKSRYCLLYTPLTDQEEKTILSLYEGG